MKALKALFAAPLLVVSSTAQMESTHTFVSNRYIEKISCVSVEDDGEVVQVSGTGFKLDDGRWVSVNHVTSNGGCRINGRSLVMLYADPEGDFSIFIVPGDTRHGGLHPDCAGYQDRHWYFATGHARGDLFAESVSVMYAKIMDYVGAEKGWAALVYNRVIPGQSGGPVLNERGEPTGTVNAYSIRDVMSFSRPLSETPICRG